MAALHGTAISLLSSVNLAWWPEDGPAATAANRARAVGETTMTPDPNIAARPGGREVKTTKKTKNRRKRMLLSATAAECETWIEENAASGRRSVHSCAKLCVTIYDQKRCKEKGGMRPRRDRTPSSFLEGLLFLFLRAKPCTVFPSARNHVRTLMLLYSFRRSCFTSKNRACRNASAGGSI